MFRPSTVLRILFLVIACSVCLLPLRQHTVWQNENTICGPAASHCETAMKNSQSEIPWEYNDLRSAV